MKKLFFCCVLASLVLFSVAGNKSPEWVKDLIIYEVAPKSFNSPGTPETGTFASLREKFPYLQELGINGIWLAGTNWADSSHFYNIWTQYACIRPDSLDSSLGTREDFRAMIEDAHKHGIRIFMDVITHGVMNDSPLITEHPQWFKGGSWGMTDYDWYGNHKDLDEWWVKTFTDYCLKDGIDGFRLDVRFYRSDLWHKIRENCSAEGKEILILQENLLHNDNMADCFQNPLRISKENTSPDYIDKGQVTDPGSFYPKMQKYYAGRWLDDLYHYAEPGAEPDDFYITIELSSHDTGWDGFPLDKNPYVAEGSRAIMGYNALLAPVITIMFAGEEFNADYVNIPRHSAALYGNSGQNKGRWLYGSWIQWDQLEKKDKAEMLEDTKRMIAIRKEHSDLLYALSVFEESERGILSLRPLQGDVYNPYVVYLKGKKAILVAGNMKDSPDMVKVRIPFSEMGFDTTKTWTATDLWHGEKQIVLSSDGVMEFNIAADHTLKGGLAVWLIEQPSEFPWMISFILLVVILISVFCIYRRMKFHR